LAHDDAVDLRRLLRASADDIAVEDAIRTALGMKRAGHEFSLGGTGGPSKAMVSIGG
jgi:GTP 3',8-cyclase